MSNVVFYRDASENFECEIQIEGASTSQSKPRLVLEFANRTFLFNGTINDGHVSIEVPKLFDISENSGNATLEIIADQTFFEAWSSPFQLKNKKSVSITEVRIGGNSPKNIKVTNISSEVSPSSIIRESCSPKNKRFVARSFERFKAMDRTEKKQITESLKEFTPKPTIEKWADKVFNDASTTYAKYCMYEVQQGMFRKSK